MTTRKIAVSLPAELVVQAQRAVAEGRASSVSAYVAGALEEKAKLDDLADLLEEMLAETGGPLTTLERQAADEALGRTAPAPAAVTGAAPTRGRAPVPVPAAVTGAGRTRGRAPVPAAVTGAGRTRGRASAPDPLRKTDRGSIRVRGDA